MAAQQVATRRAPVGGMSPCAVTTPPRCRSVCASRCRSAAPWYAPPAPPTPSQLSCPFHLSALSTVDFLLITRQLDLIRSIPCRKVGCIGIPYHFKCSFRPVHRRLSNSRGCIGILGCPEVRRYLLLAGANRLLRRLNSRINSRRSFAALEFFFLPYVL